MLWLNKTNRFWIVEELFLCGSKQVAAADWLICLAWWDRYRPAGSWGDSQLVDASYPPWTEGWGRGGPPLSVYWGSGNDMAAFTVSYVTFGGGYAQILSVGCPCLHLCVVGSWQKYKMILSRSFLVILI